MAQIKEQPAQPFDKEEVHDRLVAPLVSELIRVCKENGLPLVLSVCYRQAEDGEQSFCTTILPGTDSEGERWQPWQFSKAYDAIFKGGSSFMAFRITNRKGD